MFYIILFLIIGAIGLLCVLGAIFSTTSEDREGYGAGAIVLLIAQVVVALLFSIHQVDTRHVGVVKTFGRITGQVGEGWKFTAPWQKVEEYNIRVQYVKPETKCSNGSEQCMNAGSIDIQDVYVKTTVNLEVATRDVQSLARNVGQNYLDTIVRPRMEQATKAVISSYKADVILANREEIRHKVRDALKQELAPYSLDVSDVLLNDIDFTDGFRKQIEAKVAAEQAALAAENVVRIKEAEARQRAAEAQGEADRLRITAQGQADSNRLISQSLTPELIQFQMVQRFADNIQFYGFPTGSTPLFQLPNAGTQAAPVAR